MRLRTIKLISAFALCFLFLAVNPAQGQSGPGVVQTTGGIFSNVVSFANPVTQGDVLVAAMDANSAPGSTLSISDTLGSTWNLVYSNGFDGTDAFWWAVAPASGSDTITVNSSIAPIYYATAIAELYGVAAEDQLVGGAEGYGNNASSGFVSTSESNEVLIGVTHYAASVETPVAGTGWTWGFHGSPLAMEYEVVSTAGSYAATATYANDPLWSVHLVTFETTVPAAPTISGLSPNSGVTNTFVTIPGTQFGSTQGSSTVTFNGVAVTPVSWRPNTIVVQVPSNITSGPVVVTVNGAASNGVNFTFSPAPGVTQTSGYPSGAATFTNLVTKGDMLVAAADGPAFASTGSISDTLGSTWNLAYSNGFDGAYAFWWAIAPASGSDRVVLNGAVYNMAIAELYGVAAEDQSVEAEAYGTSNASSGLATTSEANEVLIGVIQTAGSYETPTAETGWTWGFQSWSLSMEYDAVSTAGNYAATATYANAPYLWSAHLVTFKVAPSTPLLTSIAVTPANPSIAAGTSQQFTATGTYSDSSTQDLTSTAAWSSSALSVATISTTGLATAVAQGQTTIQAAVSAINGSTTLTVTSSATSGFTATGSLNTGRSQDTATLLNNGMVLIAGGYDANSNILTGAELYNPTTGAFAPTGSLTLPRQGHTATLLNNGMVLIAGGRTSGVNETATAELYDPTTGTFTATGSMNTARFDQTATLLNNGTILITGGFDNNSNILASAELYDPVAGTFSITEPMNTARFSHTATLLNSGMVLIAGGTDVTYNGSKSAELYDPVAGTFAVTGSLNTGRGSHTATLLNSGMVLIAGGGL